jgi:hypothetical protein
MTTAQMIAPEAHQSYDRSDPAEQVFATLVRDSFEAELYARVDAAVDRQLEVFLAMQAVPYRSFREAA